MGNFPGDYDATAGYPDGLPENARVEPMPREESSADERPSPDRDRSDEEGDDGWPEGYPEYPDPLGGPIGSDVEDEKD